MASTKSASVVGMMDRSRNNASSVFKGVSFYLVDETKDEVSQCFSLAFADFDPDGFCCLLVQVQLCFPNIVHALITVLL